MKSSRQCFDVFDFKEERELGSLPPNLATKFNNENGAWKTTFMTKEMGNLRSTGGVHKVDKDHNGKNVLSDISFSTDNPGNRQMSLLNDNLLFDFSRHGQLQQATSLQDSQLDCALQESNSSDEGDDLIPDTDESTSGSSLSSSSHIAEDDRTYPLQGHETLLNTCFDIVQKMGDRNVAVVCPDYVVYRGRYRTQHVLIFSSKSVELKDSTTHGDQGISDFEWELADIVEFRSECCRSLDISMVKLQMRSKDAQGLLVFEEVQFAIFGWCEKLEKIMSLDLRYKTLWEAEVDSEAGMDEKILQGRNGECISRVTYFPNFSESFDEVVYPKGDPDAVSISRRDVDMLQPDTFVNDTIIDFYIKYLKNKVQVEERSRYHFFNSFFFRKFIDLDKDPSSAFEGRAAFQRVRKWTRKVNLFEKDYIFIPVNYSLHWSLIVICHPGEVTKFEDEDVDRALKVPCILHMDSLKGSHTVLKDIVQSYLWEEWKEKNKDASEDISQKFLNLRFVALELPQQPNMFDCGLFLLHYVECFLEEAPINFNPFRITKFENFLNPDWFPPAEPSMKRVQIQKLISKILESENSPAACSSKPCDLDLPSCSDAIETDAGFVSMRCSPLKSICANLPGSQGADGIEMTLLETSSSQYVGDSNLVLREFFEARSNATPFLDGRGQTFDQTTTFDGTGDMEENAEACGEFVYAQSNIHPGSHIFPFLPDGLGADTHETDHDKFEKYPEKSSCDSGYSSEVEVQENNPFEKVQIAETKIDEPRSPLGENLTPARNKILNDADSLPCDVIPNSHCSADDGFITSKHPDLASQQDCDHQENGYVTYDHYVVCEILGSRTDEQVSTTVAQNLVPCDGDVVCETPAPETDDPQVLVVDKNGKLDSASTVNDLVGDDLVPGTDGKEDLASIGNAATGNEFISEADGQLAGKRIVDLLPESDAHLPAKRLRIESALEEK